jgi:hypothetical protein
VEIRTGNPRNEGLHSFFPSPQIRRVVCVGAGGGEGGI